MAKTFVPVSQMTPPVVTEDFDHIAAGVTEAEEARSQDVAGKGFVQGAVNVTVDEYLPGHYRAVITYGGALIQGKRLPAAAALTHNLPAIPCDLELYVSHTLADSGDVVKRLRKDPLGVDHCVWFEDSQVFGYMDYSIWTEPANRLPLARLVFAGGVWTVTINAYSAVLAMGLGADTVDTDQIVDDAVTEDKLDDGAVATAKLAAGAVTEAKLAAGAVTETKLADGSVAWEKIQGAAVRTNNILTAAVTAEKLATGSVTELKLASEAVTEAKIGGGAVVESKILDGAVTRYKIGDEAVNHEHLEEDVFVDVLVLASDARTGVPALSDPRTNFVGGTLNGANGDVLAAAAFTAKPVMRKVKFVGVCFYTDIASAFDLRVCYKSRDAVATVEGAWHALTYSAAPLADPNSVGGYVVAAEVALPADCSGSYVCWVEVRETNATGSSCWAYEYVLGVTS